MPTKEYGLCLAASEEPAYVLDGRGHPSCV